MSNPLPARLAAKTARSRRGLGLTFLLFYALYCMIMCSRRMVYDELFAWYFGKMASTAAIIQAFNAGCDFNFPVYGLASHYSMMLLGDSDLAARLPMIFAYGVMSFVVGRIVSHRFGSGFGLAATAFLAVCGSFTFAIQARPYAITFAFSALAVLFWQRAAETGKTSDRILLAGALVCTGLTQAFSLLIVLPLTAGEVARSWSRRRIDWTIWAAMAASAIPAIPYLVVSRKLAHLQLSTPYDRPGFANIGETYSNLLAPAFGPLFVAGLLLLQFRRRASKTDSQLFWGLPLHEFVCACALALYPIYSILASVFATGRYFPRYGYQGTFGIVILATALAADRMRHRRTAGAVAAAVFITFFITHVWIFPPVTRQHSGFPSPPIGTLPPTPGGAPLITSNPNDFLELARYAPETDVARVWYLRDRESEVAFTESEELDYILPIISKWFPLRARVDSYQHFTQANRHFYLYGAYSSREDWLLKRLLKDGATATFLASYDLADRTNVLVDIHVKPSEEQAARNIE